MRARCPHDRPELFPWGQPHSDRRNFTLHDYLAMCSDGEATFTISEAARVVGVSRAELHRWMLFASVSEDEFEASLDAVVSRGLASTTALADEIKRRTGKVKTYQECCPHCGGVIRERRR